MPRADRLRRRLRDFPGAASTEFSPASISGLKLWLRSDLGITLNGSNVSAWADQSGNGNHVTQNTAANQPAYTTSSAGYNNKPLLTFATTTNWLASTNPLAIQIPQPNTVLFCGKAGASANPFACDGNVSATREAFFSSLNTPQWYCDGGPIVGTTDPAASKSAWACVANGASSKLYGPGSSSAAEATGNAGASGFTDIIIGARTGGTAGTGWGEMVEFVVYDRELITAEISRLYIYFAARYGGSWT